MISSLCNSSSPAAELPAVQWEQSCCNLCGADGAELYHRERVRYFDDLLDFRIVRCPHCGLVRTDPRLAQRNATYLCTEPDVADLEAHARAKAKVFREGIRRIIGWQKRLGMEERGSLLDIGCGSGHFLAEAQEHGFTVCGIEPASQPARYAAERFGVRVIDSDVLDVELSRESFDVITAWDVLEHVPDPKAVLSRCAAWLKPGGIMALRFPSAAWQKTKAVLFGRLLRISRPAFAPTIHLYFFNADTFERMADQVGLEVLQVRTTRTEANTGSWMLDLFKMGANAAVRIIELLNGRHIGNLEVYCRRRQTHLRDE